MEFPFEVLLTSQPGSAVLSDQVKNLDWRARQARREGKVTDAESRQVRAKLRADWLKIPPGRMRRFREARHWFAADGPLAHVVR